MQAAGRRSRSLLSPTTFGGPPTEWGAASMTPNRNIFLRIAAFSGGLSLLGTALALSDGVFWFGALARPWTPALAVMQAALAVCLLIAGRRRLGVLVLVSAIGLGAEVGFALASAKPPRAPAVTTIRVALANLAYFNTDATRVLPWLLAETPDIAVLLETTEPHHAALAPLLARLPHLTRVDAVHDAANLAVFSRFPLRDAVRFGRAGPLPQLAVEVETPERSIRLYAIHLFPPLSPAGASWQSDVLDELTERVAADAAEGRTVIVAGDLNCAPWSPRFRRFEERGRLAHGRRGVGLLNTWPEWDALTSLGIPIDHLVVGGGAAVRSLVRGPWIGSDHRPLSAVVAIP